MIERLSILLAIVLHTTTTLSAHSLFRRDLPVPTDIRELSSGPGLTPSGENDDEIKYRQDHVEDSNRYSRSRLISSLTRDFEGVGKPANPQTQSSRWSPPHSEEAFWKGHKVAEEGYGDYENDEIKREDPENPEQYEDPEEEDGEYEENEELVERQKYDEDDHKKPEVHLFGPLRTPKQRNNLEQFQQENPHFMESKARASLESQKNTQQDYKTKDGNPKIARVERPEGDASHFSYMHPEEWSRNNPECSGRLQSPVNLDSDQLVGLDVPSTLIWTGYWNRPQNLTIVDNGHSVELSGTWDEEFAPYIRGGPLVGEYLFAQLHFHWGPKDSVGSEHTINNKSFPMEMHIVHYKKDYGTLNGALKHDDGLAVVAFLFEIGETSNFGINLLEDSLSKIQNKPRVKVPVKPYPLALLHFIFQENYASYIGSLTTPPCREIVTWLVSSSPLSISRKQMESFRKISNKWPEKENYRPRQALNGRHLYYVAQ